MIKHLAFLLAMALAPAAAQAAPKPPKPPKVLPVLAQADRNIAGGRAVQVSLPQLNIMTSIDLGRIAPINNGGGLAGALIIGAMDNRQELMSESAALSADATAGPLRTVLREFNVEGLALRATQAGLQKLDWFQPGEVKLTKMNVPRAHDVFMGETAAPQVAFVDYDYGLSPDFSHIRVNAWISLADPKAAPGSYRYLQLVSSVVQLQKRSYDHTENVKSWSNDNGKLAKEALTIAFGQFERLIPLALGLSEADVKAITAKDREKAFGAGLYGPLVERTNTTPQSLVIWSRGLISVVTP
jgi:hypothetical protein